MGPNTYTVDRSRFRPGPLHGGLTYASECRGHICHVPEPGKPEDVWWFGFDCAHSGDLTPCLGFDFPGSTYHDVAYVQAECRSLAKQLLEVA